MISRTICLSLLLLSALANAVDDHHKLLLSMKYYLDDEVIKEVNFYGTEIDPNVVTDAVGQFMLTVDGVELDMVKDATYRRLNTLRRSFSYDIFTRGIRQLEPGQAMCKLGGPASGIILETRYLTYQNHKIIHEEMKPVFDQALNCLYQRRYQPVNEDARETTRGVLETLRTIAEFSTRDAVR
ncbi:hypothetical protein [Endozoicomonas sp. ONNA2]|uniref:hypothetical protein n=1 Tax=Endozoicomonas sp. ONNA2 TaxID=2828741 RepID=UPI0021491384|nr:hypothetical protein [Endozoicomonas sp. ONNA2]